MAKYYKKVSCFLLHNIPEDESQSEEDEPLCKIDEEDENVGKVRLDEDELLLGKIQQDENERRAKDQLEEDEQLAKAIQLSLNIGSTSPRYANHSLSQPSPHVFPPGFR
jgi:hypothetical protein